MSEIKTWRDRWQEDYELLGNMRSTALHFADQEIDELRARVAELEKDAMRYRWLRDDNAYWPEEQMIRGGELLDEAIDVEIARHGEVTE